MVFLPDHFSFYLCRLDHMDRNRIMHISLKPRAALYETLISRPRPGALLFHHLFLYVIDRCKLVGCLTAPNDVDYVP